MVQVRVSTPLVLICVMLLPNIKVMLLIDLVMTEQNILTDFFAVRLQPSQAASASYAIVRCLSVRPAVRHVRPLYQSK